MKITREQFEEKILPKLAEIFNPAILDRVWNYVYSTWIQDRYRDPENDGVNTRDLAMMIYFVAQCKELDEWYYDLDQVLKFSTIQKVSLLAALFDDELIIPDTNVHISNIESVEIGIDLVKLNLYLIADPLNYSNWQSVKSKAEQPETYGHRVNIAAGNFQNEVKTTIDGDFLYNLYKIVNNENY